MVGALVLSLAAPAVLFAADGEISSDGPLTRVIVSADLNCQVAHAADVSFEFFGGEFGACGTFVAVGGTVYGPAAIPAGGISAGVPWTPVGQTPASGSGRGGDPFRMTTTVETGGSAAIRIEQTDSYVLGEESYRTDVTLINGSSAQQDVVLYRAGDCYLQDSDTGFGRVDDGAPACVISQAENARIEQWKPITPGSHYFEGAFGEVWLLIASQQGFPDTCACDTALDNGAGLSWELTLPAGDSVVISHMTYLSPLGRQAATPFRDSVPGPAEINLDPVVLATSAAMAGGVVLLVPFPAALFNSTLEEHYDEVMVAIRRVRGWLARLFGGLWQRGTRVLARSPGTEESGGASADVSPPQASSGRARIQLDEAFWRSPLGILAFLLASALLYGLLDPTFGLDLASLATFQGLALGTVVMLLAFGVPAFIGGRGHGLGARALPGTLIIAIGCVLISRLADFQPGYLYGLIIGFTFARPLARREAGRLDAVAASVALGLAVVAWIGLPFVRAGASAEQGFVNGVLETAFATVVVAGLEAAAVAMLPIRFLPGERVRDWNRRVWAVLLGVATFGFLHILVNPASGYLADATRSSLFTVILLLVIFGGGSVLFWAYFRFRPARAEPDAAS